MNKNTAIKYVVVPAATYAAFKLYDRIAIKRANKNLELRDDLQTINDMSNTIQAATFVK